MNRGNAKISVASMKTGSTRPSIARSSSTSKKRKHHPQQNRSRQRKKSPVFKPVVNPKAFPQWKNFADYMRKSHHESRRETFFKSMGVRRHITYKGYKGKLIEGQLNSYEVPSPESLVQSDTLPFEYIMNDNPVVFEEFKEYGVGTDKIRIMCPDFSAWLLDLDKAHVLKPIRRILLQLETHEHMADSPLLNTFVYLERCRQEGIGMLINWLNLHKEELVEWIDLEDDLDEEPQFGVTEPFNDISEVDQKFLDRLLSPIAKFIYRKKYYHLLLELGRVSYEMELCPLQILIKKYLTNLLHGKSSKAIWQVFRLRDVVPTEFRNDPIYLEYLIKAYQQKLGFLAKHLDNDTFRRESGESNASSTASTVLSSPSAATGSRIESEVNVTKKDDTPPTEPIEGNSDPPS